jgi:hypothetical protein
MQKSNKSAVNTCLLFAAVPERCKNSRFVLQSLFRCMLHNMRAIEGIMRSLQAFHGYLG